MSELVQLISSQQSATAVRYYLAHMCIVAVQLVQLAVLALGEIGLVTDLSAEPYAPGPADHGPCRCADQWRRVYPQLCGASQVVASC